MKSLSEQNKQLYDRGMQAFSSQNWDYAIALFTEVLDTSPDYAPARSQLRMAETHKFDSRKFPKVFVLFSNIVKLYNFVKILFFRYKKNWPSIMKLIEKSLRYWPKDYKALLSLGKIAEKSDFPEAVCSIYETMYVLKPSDIYVLKKLGQYYHKLEQAEKARTFYKKALSIAPMDYEARKGVQNLAALGTIDKGWKDEGSYREKIKDKDQSGLFEKETRLARSEEDKRDLIKDVLKQLSEKPKSIPLIIRLAKLYMSVSEYDKVIKLYNDAIELDPADSTLKKDLSDAKISQIDSQIKEIDNDSIKAKELTEKKQKFILEDTQNRVEEYPTHLPLRYEMGTVYMSRQLWDQAIGEFQISLKDPKYKILSLNNLGLCFYNKKMYDLSENQFKKAGEELYEWDDLKKEILYNLGLVYEAMGKTPQALDIYKKIYEQDITYRDIAQKISKAY